MPNPAKLLVNFARRHILQQKPGFRFTSIQANKNYSAKLHVDRNNRGPSFIFGLGDYEGGGLWPYDPEGEYPVTITTPLRGFEELCGKEVMGKLYDIKNKWVEYDGNMTHAALPHTGTRLSLVYFCRADWEKLPADRKRYLEKNLAVARGRLQRLPFLPWRWALT
jgi:hypothetical protein